MNHILKIKKLNENAVVPAQATAGSAGMDLSACLDNDVIIAPGEIKLIPTGLAAAPDTDQCALLIYPRSGLASKHGISLANCVGVVDSDYRGEVKVMYEAKMYVDEKEIVVKKGYHSIKAGERIAQMLIERNEDTTLVPVAELSETKRGTGGFGSTGW